MKSFELLQHLGEVDPVDAELLDSVVGQVLAAAAASQHPPLSFFDAHGRAELTAPATYWPGAPDPGAGGWGTLCNAGLSRARITPTTGRGRPRPVVRARSRTAWGTALASAALVVAAAALAGMGALPMGGSSTARQAPGGWQLLAATTSPFADVAPGSADGTLQCVTETTCYADALSAAPGSRSGLERTTDGGRTWHFLSPLPGGARLSSAPLSCPTTQMCMGVAREPISPQDQARLTAALQAVRRVSLRRGTVSARAARAQAEASFTKVRRSIPLPATELVVTTDGGASWSVDRLVSSPNPQPVFRMGDRLRVDCATAQVCVASAESQMFVTRDGGRTWAQQPPIPLVASPGGLYPLHCAADGACIGVEPLGSFPHTSMVALRSKNFGRTWTAGPPVRSGGAIYRVTCADTTHCMALRSAKDGFTVASTADAGRSWQVVTVATSTFPPGWVPTARSLACATGQDCWISVSAGPVVGNAVGDKTASIYRTVDAGATWTQLPPLPLVDGAPLVMVYPMSCPSALGCIAVGATASQFDPLRAPGKRFVPSGREILSDLPAS